MRLFEVRRVLDEIVRGELGLDGSVRKSVLQIGRRQVF